MALHTGLLSKDHYGLMAMFEKEFSHRRLDKEPKALWVQGSVYQDGQTNELFLAFRKGCAYGKSSIAMEAA